LDKTFGLFSPQKVPDMGVIRGKFRDFFQMKRLSSEKIYEDIKNMKIKEELAYWQQATKELEKLQSQS